MRVRCDFHLLGERDVGGNVAAGATANGRMALRCSAAKLGVGGVDSDLKRGDGCNL